MALEMRVLAWLAHQDCEAYLVGGSVRDWLLGRPIYDLDFAVAGDGLELARRLADRFSGDYYALDRTRGTGRAILYREGDQALIVDVAGLRGPSLVADLADRDFTINSLAFDVRQPGEVIDHHDGLADLKAGVIRAVSDDSIRNDPLRALRAFRQSSQLGFHLHPATNALIRRDGADLAHVSGERVRDEVSRLLALPMVSTSLSQMDDLGLLTIVLPEMEPLRGLAQSPPHELDGMAHSLETVRRLEGLLAEPAATTDCGDGIPSGLSPFAENLRVHLGQIMSDTRPRLVSLKLAALLHDCGKPQMRSVDDDGRIRFIGHESAGAKIGAEALHRLRFSRNEVQLVETVVRNHMRPLLLAEQESVSSRAVYRFFRDTGDAGVEVLLLALGDHLATSGYDHGDKVWYRLLSLTCRMFGDYWERRAERVVPPTLVSGHDLLGEFGLEPGPHLGALLETVREAQVSGQVHTREEALALIRAELSGQS